MSRAVSETFDGNTDTVPYYLASGRARNTLCIHSFHKVLTPPLSLSSLSMIPSRSYVSTFPSMSSESFEAIDEDGTSGRIKLYPRQLARIYDDRRSAHKRAVTKLRKQYSEEIEAQRAIDEREELESRAVITRAKLERQRLKNIRSARNGFFEEGKRAERLQKLEKELDVVQQSRKARHARFDKARRFVLQELEEEAPMWITTRDEVNVVLDNPIVIQELWTRPGGYVGVPNPIDGDGEFWRYESHTWDMARTYPSPRQLLLEELEEMSYQEANVDDRYWKFDRLEEQKALENKAKLRAMVREAGRKALLLKQRDMMRDRYAADTAATGSIKEDGSPLVPCPMPTPSLGVLANYDAMELEGTKILEADPEKFFHFEHNIDMNAVDTRNGVESTERVNRERPMKRPVRLRDLVRDNSPMGTPYPLLVGRIVKYDTRTEKEKRREEREERMWAAAQAQASSGVEFFAEDDIGGIGESIDYDEIGNSSDEEEIEWEKGLDPVNDADLLNMPREMRYTEEDIDWVIRCLEQKVKTLQEIVKLEDKNAKQMISARKHNIVDNNHDHENIANISEEGLDGTVEKMKDDDNIIETLAKHTFKKRGVDVKGRVSTEYNLLDDDTDIDMYMDLKNIIDRDVKGLTNMKNIQNVMSILNSEQIDALEDLENDKVMTTVEDIKAMLCNVPGLTDDQEHSLVRLEMSLLHKNDLLVKVEMKRKEN